MNSATFAEISISIVISNVINAKGKPFKEVPAQIIDYDCN
jgi:hypothetical protein